MSDPIFLDPSGRRGRRARGTLAGLLLILFAAAAVFAATIVDVPLPGPLPPHLPRTNPHAFAERTGRARHKPVRRGLYGGTWLPAAPAKGAHEGRPMVSAF